MLNKRLMCVECGGEEKSAEGDLIGGDTFCGAGGEAS